MADVKQILVVDDHFEMLEFLRSMLELSSRDYQVLGVPSAEEGFLELRRTPFNLLITDLRLPGMSGFDLIRKVQRFRPEIPIIMITGYSSEQGQKEAADLGIFRYFQKPLDTDGLLAAVRDALYGSEPVPEPAAAAPVSIEVSGEVRKRLDMLRTDTGAKQIVMASVQGHVLYESGYSSNLDLAALAATMAGSVHNSFRLAEQLGSDDPFMFHYQSGRTFDIYSANVGRDCFVAMFFDTESRRGRIGTIWVFAQRGIRELAALMPAAQLAAPASKKAAEPAAKTTAPVTAPVQPVERGRTAARPVESRPAKAVVKEPEAPPPPKPEPAALPPVELAATPAPAENELDAFWDSAVQAETALEPAPVMDIAGLVALGLPADKLAEVDVDAFWDAALTDDEPAPAGLSLEEAMRQGLLGSGFQE
jgi:DNA-binding response OmpR family regulator